jgi:hypothetical protein
MEENTCVEQRRSRRIMLSVRVIVQGTSPTGTPILEETQTVVVNAHGAFLSLKAPVAVGQVLTVRNLRTEEEMFCKVARVVRNEAGDKAVGLEFVYPSARFWRIAFPPKDWSPQPQPA